MASFTYDPDTTPSQETLVERVEYRVDQVTAQGQTTPVNRKSTYQELVEAGRSILRRVPRELVYPAAADGSASVAPTNDGRKTVIPVPDDFIRFLRVRLPEWKHAVDEFVPLDSSRYRLQANPFTSADEAHPIASLAPYFSGSVNQAVECYPQDATPTVELFAYVPDTAPEQIPEELRDALTWEAAGRVLQSTKEDGAGAAFEASTRAISGLRYGLMGEDRPAE
jgi:hypothetical protein